MRSEPTQEIYEENNVRCGEKKTEKKGEKVSVILKASFDENTQGVDDLGYFF